MNSSIKHALLQMFALQKEASENQARRGHSDRGARSGVSSGKHLEPLAKEIGSVLNLVGSVQPDPHVRHVD